MAVNICRNLIAQERTFSIPAQDDLVMRLIPHQSQRIDLAIEGTPIIDRTMRGCRVECGALVPGSLSIGNHGHLATMLVRKRRPSHAGGDGLLDLLTCEIRAKRTVGVGKPATDIATKAGAAGH